MRGERRTLITQIGVTTATAARIAQQKDFNLKPLIELFEQMFAEEPDSDEVALVPGQTWAERWEEAERESEDEEEPDLPAP